MIVTIHWYVTIPIFTLLVITGYTTNHHPSSIWHPPLRKQKVITATIGFVESFSFHYYSDAGGIVALRTKNNQRDLMAPIRRQEVRLRRPSHILRPYHLLLSKEANTELTKMEECATNETTTATTTEKAPMTTARSYEFVIHSSIHEISEHDWNHCIVVERSSPFLKYSFLKCLEESNCASAQTGWIPQHLVIYEQQQQNVEEAKNVSYMDHNQSNPTNLEIINSKRSFSSTPIFSSISYIGSSSIKNNDSNSVTTRKIVGVVPMYLKSHSLGEFIFDQAFAQAAFQNRIQYYPKILVAIPFTPVTGQRINWNVRNHNQTSWNRAVGQFLQQIAIQNGISSVHCNFVTDQEATDLAGPLQYGGKDDEQVMDDVDDVPLNSDMKKLLNRLLLRGKKKKIPLQDRYLRRTSLQYHWMNQNPKNNSQPFLSFDDYLNSCFKSKKRITIKRERKSVRIDQNITIHVISGIDIMKYNKSNKNPKMTLIKRMFEIYASTIQKMSYWGRQYLTYEFFQLLCQTDFIQHIVFICARQRRSSTTNTNEYDMTTFDPDDVFAGTINIVGNGVFYGRYWGCLPQYDIKNLHFEVCYWSAIEYCIQNGYKRMEPGAGGGDYKWARGFNPSLIHSVHYICHPGLRQAVHDYLEYETEDNIELTEYLRSKSGSAINTTTTPR